MTIVGETYVRVLPETSGFAPALEADVTAGSRTAGAAAGREASAGFQSGFKAPAGLSQVESELGKVDRGATAAAFSFTGFGRAVAYASGTFLVAGSAVATLKASVETAGQIQGQQALLTKSIDNAHASTTLYGQSVDALVQKQALQTGFTETDLLPALARLVQATGDTSAAYKDLELAEDLARQRGTDVAQAALAVGKAADGSVTSLQRYGIVLPATAKGMDTTQKAALALDLAQQKVGGSAALYAETGAGALARLSVASEVLKEEIGVALLPEVEHLAVGLTTWLESSQHLQAIQHDVAQGVQVIDGVVHGAADAFHVLDTAVSPVVSALGGYGHTAEVVFGAVAISKVQKLLVSTGELFAAEVAGAGKAAAAEDVYTASVDTNTVALEGNAAAAATVAGTEGVAAIGTAATVAEGKVALLGSSLTGLSTLTIAPIAIPVILDIRSQAESEIKKLPGGHFLSGVFADATLFGPALYHAIKDAVEGDGKGRSGLPPGVVGPTAKTGAVWGHPPGIQGPQGVLAAGVAQRPTDADYKLAVDAALQTPGTGDELALYRSRAAYLAKRIDRLKADSNLDAAQKKQLEQLYQQRDQVEQSISSITTAAANARKQQVQNAKTAYTTALSDHEQLLKIAQDQAALTTGTGDDTKANQALLAFYKKEADDTRLALSQRQTYQSDALQLEGQVLQTEQTTYQTQLSLREQRLQLQVQRAQLTTNSLADDRKAEKALILFYQQEAHDMKLTAAQRLQYQSQAVAAQLQLQQLNGTATGATVAQIFGEAASEFASYGSNIAGRNGVLSGQDERARLSMLLLSHASRIDVGQTAADQRALAHLTEARKQTGLQTKMVNSLAAIESQLRPGKPDNSAIEKARKTAGLVGIN